MGHESSSPGLTILVSVLVKDVKGHLPKKQVTPCSVIKSVLCWGLSSSKLLETGDPFLWDHAPMGLHETQQLTFY